VHITDILPSFLELAGIEYPKTFNGITPNALQGVSFISSIKNNNWNRPKPIFYEWSGYRAVWDGNWKAVSNYPENKWELYDLSIDRTESKNLAKNHPEIVEKMNNAYKNWAKANSDLNRFKFKTSLNNERNINPKFYRSFC
jgi:arylsulfatase A-like enzyme